jgi:hypothetical protein
LMFDSAVHGWIPLYESTGKIVIRSSVSET